MPRSAAAIARELAALGLHSALWKAEQEDAHHEFYALTADLDTAAAALRPCDAAEVQALCRELAPLAQGLSALEPQLAQAAAAAAARSSAQELLLIVHQATYGGLAGSLCLVPALLHGAADEQLLFRLGSAMGLCIRAGPAAAVACARLAATANQLQGNWGRALHCPLVNIMNCLKALQYAQLHERTERRWMAALQSSAWQPARLLAAVQSCLQATQLLVQDRADPESLGLEAALCNVASLAFDTFSSSKAPAGATDVLAQLRAAVVQAVHQLSQAPEPSSGGGRGGGDSSVASGSHGGGGHPAAVAACSLGGASWAKCWISAAGAVYAALTAVPEQQRRPAPFTAGQLEQLGQAAVAVVQRLSRLPAPAAGAAGGLPAFQAVALLGLLAPMQLPGGSGERELRLPQPLLARLESVVAPLPAALHLWRQLLSQPAVLTAVPAEEAGGRKQEEAAAQVRTNAVLSMGNWLGAVTWAAGLYRERAAALHAASQHQHQAHCLFLVLAAAADAALRCLADWPALAAAIERHAAQVRPELARELSQETAIKAQRFALCALASACKLAHVLAASPEVRGVLPASALPEAHIWLCRGVHCVTGAVLSLYGQLTVQEVEAGDRQRLKQLQAAALAALSALRAGTRLDLPAVAGPDGRPLPDLRTVGAVTLLCELLQVPALRPLLLAAGAASDDLAALIPQHMAWLAADPEACAQEEGPVAEAWRAVNNCLAAWPRLALHVAATEAFASAERLAHPPASSTDAAQAGGELGAVVEDGCVLEQRGAQDTDKRSRATDEPQSPYDRLLQPLLGTVLHQLPEAELRSASADGQLFLVRHPGQQAPEQLARKTVCELAADQLAGLPPLVPPRGSELERAVLLEAAAALGTRRCACLACTNVAGSSEAAVAGRRCGGCGAVRYCSEACSRLDWRAHRRACRLLSAVAATAAEAES